MDKKEILKKLNEIVDPEIGFGIVDLGEIDDVIIEDKKVIIKFLPTSPFCPFLPYFFQEIYLKMKEIGLDAEIDIVLDKKWTPDRIKKDIREKLNL